LPEKCVCYAVMNSKDPGRADLWKRIFPQNGHLPIRSPIPAGTGRFPDSESHFYYMDMSRVTPEQKQMIIQELARKFHLTEDEVASDIERVGIPIKADDVMVSWCPLHVRSVL
jgi:hypothetical protein